MFVEDDDDDIDDGVPDQPALNFQIGLTALPPTSLCL